MMYNVLEKLCAHGSGHPTFKPKLKIGGAEHIGITPFQNLAQWWSQSNTSVMKGTEVPNLRRSSACDCTSVLTRIDYCLVTLSCLPWACLCKVRSQISDALLQALCNLSLAFLADFTPSDSTALIRFIAFSRKLHSAFPWAGKFEVLLNTKNPEGREILLGQISTALNSSILGNLCVTDVRVTTAVRKLKFDGCQLLSELCQEPNTAQHEHKLCNIQSMHAIKLSENNMLVFLPLAR